MLSQEGWGVQFYEATLQNVEYLEVFTRNFYPSERSTFQVSVEEVVADNRVTLLIIGILDYLLVVVAAFLLIFLVIALFSCLKNKTAPRSQQ